jgi:Xaa-Pro aminopeptidase
VLKKSTGSATMCLQQKLVLGLQAGMILSDEPGYYEDGKFGIRIENLVKIIPANTKHNFQGIIVMANFCCISYLLCLNY